MKPRKYMTLTYLSLLLLLGTLLFVFLPFLAVIREGLPFLLSLHWPEEIRQALLLSLWTSLLASSLAIFITLPVVYAINALPRRWRQSLLYLFSLPMGTPHLVSGIALLIVYGGKGLGPFLLETFGLDFVYTTNGIVLAMLFINLPFSIITLQGAYNLVDPKLVFTARTLGLTEAQACWHVVIPMLRRALIATWIMNWSRSIGEFGAIMILVGITRLKTETLATSIFLNLSTGDFDVATGVATLLLLLSVFVMFLAQKISPLSATKSSKEVSSC